MDNFLGQLIQGIGHLGQQQTPQPIKASPQPVYQAHPTPAQMQNSIPTGQPIPQGYMNSYSPQVRQLAQIYNQNPMDARVAHIDPAIFGYAPDQTAQQPSTISPYHTVDNGHTINSLSFRNNGYGGTIGLDNGKIFMNGNQNGQATDPLAALRGMLGL